MGGQQLEKGIECLHCKWVYDKRCKGHKPNADCINYEEREEPRKKEVKNERCQVD